MLDYLALMPHPPMIIPAIGKEQLKRVQPTVEAMQMMSAILAKGAPEAVVFLTPHGNVFSDCITCLGEAKLYGDFGSFGHPEVNFAVLNDLVLLKEISILAVERGIELILVDQDIARQHRLNGRLDHGVLVPLYYLKRAGLAEDTPIIALSTGGLPVLDLYLLGKCIQEAADNAGKKIAVIASGDMSHRLKDDGPYNYHQDGPAFDSLVKEYLSQGRVEKILQISEDLRENAGECGYRSIVIMLGCMDGYEIIPQLYAYEGPYGVGYLTADFKLGHKKTGYLDELTKQQSAAIKARRDCESLPVRWARMVLEGYIAQGIKPKLPAEMKILAGEQAAAFVTLKKKGKLRGCIGTIKPAYPNLAEELAHNAISAGTNDHRFWPVGDDELKDLEYSVDILSNPEKCSLEQLDPKEYGVIVSKGNKRGLLLPDLEGVDTVEQQLAIALEKARINTREDYIIERFKVTRYY